MQTETVHGPAIGTVLQGLCNLAAPTRLSRPRREDCYVAVRRASIHTEAICITGPALPCPYTQTKGHYLRTMPLVWHNERSSESHSKPLWNRNGVARWPYGQAGTCACAVLHTFRGNCRKKPVVVIVSQRQQCCIQ